MVGGQRMTRVWKRLEHMTRGGLLSEAPELIRDIGEDFADLRSALTSEMNEG